MHAYMNACVHARRHTHTYICMHAYIHTYIHTDRQTDIQTDRQTDVHTYVCTYVHIRSYRQTNGRTDGRRDRETDVTIESICLPAYFLSLHGNLKPPNLMNRLKTVKQCMRLKGRQEQCVTMRLWHVLSHPLPTKHMLLESALRAVFAWPLRWVITAVSNITQPNGSHGCAPAVSDYVKGLGATKCFRNNSRQVIKWRANVDIR